MSILIETVLNEIQQTGFHTAKDVVVSGTVCTLPSQTTIGGSSVSALGVVTSTSANAVAVGRQGATGPAFNVDASTSLQADGFNVKGLAAGSGVQVKTITTGTNAPLAIDAAGSGTLTLAGTSTGNLVLGQSLVQRNTLSALNSTGTITAAMLATGGITSTSGSAVTATLDTIANIGTLFGTPTAGFRIPFFVQNPGSNTVTVAVSSGIVAAKQVSSGDTATDVLLTVAASATVGSAMFEIMFISASAAVLHRIY